MDKEFRVGELRMICASSEAGKRKYHKYEDNKRKGYFYLVADQVNAADNIYCGYDHDTKSDGFGGRWLTFELVGGGEIQLQGPWHTNSDDLFRHTGIDIRNIHATIVVIGKSVRYEEGNCNPIIYDLVYQDEDWVISDFDRKETIDGAMKESTVPLYVYKESKGGSSRCWHYPEGTTHKDWEQYLEKHCVWEKPFTYVLDSAEGIDNDIT